MLKPLTLGLATIVCGLAVSAQPQAQDLPSRPIKIIVLNPPGGAGDISARLVGQKLSEALHQPVVVENQAGASGSIGMGMLKRAAPDGTTIGVVLSLSQTIDLVQNGKHSFDIVKDFTPITAIANNPSGLAGQFADPVDDHGGFHRAGAGASPAPIPMAAPARARRCISTARCSTRSPVSEMVNVPYKGVAPAFNDLLGGHIPIAIVSVATALPHLARRQGAAPHRIRHQAASAGARRADHHRSGAAMTPGRAWIGFLARQDLPPPIAARLTRRDRAHPEIAGRRGDPRQERARCHRQRAVRLCRHDRAGFQDLGRGGGHGRPRARDRRQIALDGVIGGARLPLGSGAL